MTMIGKNNDHGNDGKDKTTTCYTSNDRMPARLAFGAE